MKDFVTQSNERIKQYEAEVARVKSLIPFDQMTMEDFKDAYPDAALNPLEKPTFWPHDPEEQLKPEEIKH